MGKPRGDIMKIILVILAVIANLTWLFLQIMFFVGVADAPHREATEWYALGWWYFLPWAAMGSVAAALANGKGIDMMLILVNGATSIGYLAVLVLNIVFTIDMYDRFIDCQDNKSPTVNEAKWCADRKYMITIQFVAIWVIMVVSAFGLAIHIVDAVRAVRNFMSSGDDDSNLASNAKASGGSVPKGALRPRKYASDKGN